jgi:ABC-2 type transport system permease protein
MNSLKRYQGIVLGSFMTNLAYPVSFFMTLITNLIYIVVLYFLWKAVYSGTLTLHGMTFHQTFIYVALGGTIIVLFQTWTDHHISWRILNGVISLDLAKPLDFQLMILASEIGMLLMRGVAITLPSILAILAFVQGDMLVGINIPFFLMSLVGAFLLIFAIDFTVGLTAFYTEALWGISASKEVLINFLAGGLLPLAFFPEGARQVLSVLPFQAIYSIPLQIATNASLSVNDYVKMIAVQAFWAVVFVAGSRLIFARVIKRLTINGG